MGNFQAARSVLSSVWGYADFRGLQRRIIVAVLAKRDVMALLPTGGGKSLCFQVPALVLPGTTVVVSPLISLMQDQVGALQGRQVAASYLSSTQSQDVQATVWENLYAGKTKILYIAPERLSQLIERMGRLPIPLLAIDEAHCISEWGHDFRPRYRTIGKYRLLMGRPPTIAVTATATRQTQLDIMNVLYLNRPVIVRQSVDRPNLFFKAKKFMKEGERLRTAARLLHRANGSSIVYVPTRSRTDGVTTVLRWWNIPAFPYHAGLPGRERRLLLRRFMHGRIRVMVATNAFGMGIDKPDVRQVIHLGIPTRPEAYYQEAGRAGRDGEVSTCSLFWTPHDFRLAKHMVMARPPGDHPDEIDLAQVRKNGLQVMRKYVTTRGCRRRVLMEFLGEPPNACSGCDRCFR